ncbi:MAG: Tex-like N-terminal domain-containing protein [Candidatus Methanoperedens sp.]
MKNPEFLKKINIAKDLELNDHSVKNTVKLFEDGATIPFIARYRKEKTHGLDETVIRSILSSH